MRKLSRRWFAIPRTHHLLCHPKKAEEIRHCSREERLFHCTVEVPSDANESGPTRENRDADGAADSSDNNKPGPSRWQADVAENTPNTEAENDCDSSVMVSSDAALTPQSRAKTKKNTRKGLIFSSKNVPGRHTVSYRSSVQYRTLARVCCINVNGTVPYCMVPVRYLISMYVQYQ